MSNSLKIVFSPEAEIDLDNIFAYISENLSAPQAAADLITRVERTCQRLIDHPFSCPVPKNEYLAEKGYRMLVIENFIAFYVVGENAINVMRIIYGKRDYQKLL